MLDTTAGEVGPPLLWTGPPGVSTGCCTPIPHPLTVTVTTPLARGGGGEDIASRQRGFN